MESEPTSTQEPTPSTEGMSLDNPLVQSLIWQVIVPIVAILAIKAAVSALYAYIMSLWIEGKSNEWVLIMKNG